MSTVSKSLRTVSASSQWASIADASQTGLDFTGNFTLEWTGFFATLPSSGNEWSLIGKHDGTDTGRSYLFRLKNNGGTLQLSLRVSSNGTSAAQSESVVNWTPTANVWYHVACIYDTGGNVSFTVNGVQQGTTQTGAQTSVFNGTAAFGINSSVNGSDFVDGRVSVCRAWNTNLAISTILANYQSILGATTNLQGEWSFDNVYTDDSGNSNTLTSSGSPVFIGAAPSYLQLTGLQYLDTLSNYTVTGGTTSVGGTHQVNGSNNFLTAWVFSQTTTDDTTGVTYNGVAMTKVTSIAKNTTEGYLSCWRLIAPATGANTITATRSGGATGVFWISTANYNGIKQSAEDNSTSTTVIGSTSLTCTLTTVADNCYLVMGAFSDNGNVSAGASTTLQQSATTTPIISDSNGQKSPAGSYSLVNNSSSGNNVGIMLSLAPVPAPTSGFFFLAANQG